MSKSSSAFAAANVPSGTAVSAYDMDAYDRACLPLCVYDIDCALVAGDVKLKLCEMFGDETAVYFVSEGKAEKINLFELDRQKTTAHSPPP